MPAFIDHLQHDHQVIQQVVAGISAVADLLEAGHPLDTAVLFDVVQFLRIFAGSCHHAKEELFLFPLIQQHVNAQGSRELHALENEHRRAAELVERLAGIASIYIQNPVVLRPRLISVLRSLAELYPAHIWKEEHLLYPVAAHELARSEQHDLTDQFERHEAEVGSDVHNAFEALATKLEAVVRFRSSGVCPLCSPAA